jgi:HEAT repeat protein
MADSRLDQIAQQLDSLDACDRMLALVALRQISAAEAEPLIQKALSDENLPVRSLAVRALGGQATDTSYNILVHLLSEDPDYEIRAGAAAALGDLKEIRALQTLARAFFEDTSWVVRFSAAAALGHLQDPRAHEVLIHALRCDETVIQQAAIAALGEIQDLAAVDDLLQFVQSEDWLSRQRLAEALGNLHTAKSQSALNYLSKDDHPHVAQAAQDSLQRWQDHG